MKFAWGEISYELLETGFADWPARDKTFKSVHRVTKRIPDEEIAILLKTIGIIFAPAAGKQGTIKAFLGSTEKFARGKVMLFLPTEIEDNDENKMDSIVATEFARVLLKNYQSPNSPPIGTNDDVHRKILEWGFS